MEKFLGIIVMTAVPVMFYLLVFWCLKCVNITEDLRKISRKDWLVTVVILLGSCVFTCFVIKQNKFVYYWDYGREWSSAISVSNGLLSNIWGTLKDVYNTTNTQDYGRMMPMLIALPLKIFGNSFARYVVITEVFYMCPAIMIISLLTNRIINKISLNKPKLSYIVFIIATIPILYYVEFNGFMDPPVLILVACILLLAFDFDYKKFDLKRSALISICFLLLVLFRRYFAYWVVGFILSQLFNMIFQLKEEKENKKQVLIGYIQNMMFIGVFCLLFLFIFVRGFLIQSVFNNFSVAYVGYNVNWREKFKRVLEVFGWIVLVFSFLIPTIRMKKKRLLIPYVVIYIVNIFATAFLLWRVLQMDYHHYYLIMMQIIILAVIGVYEVIELLREERFKKIFMGIVLGYCALNICVCFIPQIRNLPLKSLFTQRYYDPKYRSDMDQIYAMIEDLNNLCGSDVKKRIYMVSSSGTLNSNTLSLALMPETNNAIPQLCSTYNVDLRDGFPETFLDADIVVVGDPVQIHLPAESQQIITYLTEQMLDKNSYLGKHYELYKEYKLENDVSAKVYIRCSRLTESDYEKLKNYYDDLYPEYPELFKNRLKYPESFFPNNVGEILTIIPDDGILASEFADKEFVSDKAGQLVYGPYKRIESGVYSVTFEYEYNGDMNPGEAIGYVDLYINSKVISEKEIFAGDNTVTLETCIVNEIDDYAEVRMYVNVEGVKFDKVTITRIE